MQDFFTNFPKVGYGVDGFNKQAINLAISELVVRLNVDRSYILWEKELIDYDTPISVSDEVYGTTEYYWTIMYINNVVNPYKDWFLGQTDLELYVDAKYSTGMNGLHHFEDRSDPKKTRSLDDVRHKATLAKYTAIPKQYIGELIFPVTNLMYERRLNDAKKFIDIVSPKFILEFVDSFNRILKNRK